MVAIAAGIPVIPSRMAGDGTASQNAPTSAGAAGKVLAAAVTTMAAETAQGQTAKPRVSDTGGMVDPAKADNPDLRAGSHVIRVVGSVMLAISRCHAIGPGAGSKRSVAGVVA